MSLKSLPIFAVPENMKVANNVMIFDWIPQNDILGHDKLKAFVSHVGANGAYEAAYHGVPLVAACIWGDNMDNAVRFVQKAKMAKLIDVFKADSSVWQNTLEEIINNSRYISAYTCAIIITVDIRHLELSRKTGICSR